MKAKMWIIPGLTLILAGCGHVGTQKDLANSNPPAVSDALIAEMKGYFAENEGLINHTVAVLGYAEQIRQEEGGDSLVVKAAAIYHDIGIPQARRVHGSSAGKYQEIEGPPIARNILDGLGLDVEKINHICRIIANHHTAHDERTTATIEFKIIWDADALVNLRKKLTGGDEQTRRRIIDERFRTATGRRIAQTLHRQQ